MDKYETPIIICHKFSEQDIITTSTQTAVDAVTNQLIQSAGVSGGNIQTVKWDIKTQVDNILQYKE